MQPRTGQTTRRELLAAGAGAAVALSAGAPPAAAARAAATPRGPALGFTSLAREVRLPRLDVEGRVPDWLRGILLRNGPAQFEVGDRTFNHWFDGLAMLHAFAFGAGRVSYANRFLRSSAYDAWKQEGRILYSEFGTDPCRTTFSGIASIPIIAPVSNANVSIEQLGRTFVAHTEIPIPVKFDEHTLRTLGVSGAAPTGRLGTAHPHHDPATGERFFYEVDVAASPGYRVIAEHAGRRRTLATIPRAKPGYMHSFALTRHYVVLFEQPFVLDPASFLDGQARAIVEHYAWDPAQPARVIVVDRHGGGVRAQVDVDPMFVFHHINAAEVGHELHLDVCAYRDATVVDALTLKRLRAVGQRLPPVAARRVVVDLRRKRAAVHRLAGVDFELPRIDDDRNQRAYRYAYGIGVRPGATFTDQIVKLDVARGDAKVWREHDCYPGEPIFVPGPRRRGEDDGALLSVVLDAARGTSFLLVLDARSMHERARAVVPHHIPFGFHGLHVAA